MSNNVEPDPIDLAEPLHEHLRRHARAMPQQTAIVWYGRRISYRELDELSDRCAAVLARHGVRQGDPVALFMQNCPQYAIAHFGIQKLGAIVNPCSPLFKGAELAYQLGDLGARVLIAAESLHDVVEAASGETAIRTVFGIRYADLLPAAPEWQVPAELTRVTAPMRGSIDLWAEIAHETAAPPRPRIGLDDVALIIYTSGTTGRPKGAMLTFDNALFKTAGLASVAGLTSQDVHLAVPPLYHISGMLYGLNLPVFTGAASVLHYRFDPVATLESIERCRVTYWKAIAPMLVAVIDASQATGARQYDLSSLRVTSASSFGIRTTPELSQRWAAFTGGCIATEAGYGLSETHTGDVVTLPATVRWGTNGQPLPGVRVRIVDPSTGGDVATGEQGEIALSSRGNFKGYLNQPDKTAQTLRDGWVFTGDIGRLDADGFVTLLGRTKELIKVSGYSVFPEDVEALLLEHPRVRQVGVVGVADAAKGEVVKAVVVQTEAEEPLTAEALIAWCRDHMSAYKVPRIIDFRSELPVTGSGKLLRRLL